MIVAAALCPAPPLLAGELTGQADILPELRHACAVAVARLVAAAPDVIAVVGPADLTATWDPAGHLDLAAYAPALARPATVPGRAAPSGAAPTGTVPGRAVPGRAASGRAASAAALGRPAAALGSVGSNNSKTPEPADEPPVLPLALGIGALLLDKAGYDGPRAMWSVAGSASPAECARLGQDIVLPAERVALLVMGDGSARRSESAPGYLDQRAEPFDAEFERAVRDGDMAALAALDPVLAHGLMADGRPAWQVLAGALGAGGDGAPRTEILYSAAPFGVGYLVAAVLP